MSRCRTLAALALGIGIARLATAQEAPAKTTPAAPVPGVAPPSGGAPASAGSAMPPQPPPPPGYYVPYPYPYYYPPPPPPPEPAPQKKSRLYLQLALGPGLFRAHNSSSPDERHFSGTSVSGQFFLGGRVDRVIAIGAGYIHDQIFALSAKDQVIDGDEPDLSNTTFSIDSICFFQDYSVPPAPGLHFPVWLGFSELTDHTAARSRSSDPTLLLLGFGAGYELDVGSHFHVGALLRATIASYSVRENNGTDVTSFLPALLLTGTYDPSR